MKRLWSVIFILAMGCSLRTGVQPLGENPEEGETTVLFIGNSLTYYHQMPLMVNSLAEKENYPLFVAQYCIPGSNLIQHSENPLTKSAIQERKWDIVVLQGANVYTAFPEYHYLYLPALTQLKHWILDSNPSARILFMLDWCWAEGIDWEDRHYTLIEYIEQNRIGTKILADTLDFGIAPVSWAFKRALEERPDLELFEADGAHPSIMGSYLQSAVYFSVFFLSDSRDIGFIGGLDVSLAALLRRIGSETVLDEIAAWNLE